MTARLPDAHAANRILNSLGPAETAIVSPEMELVSLSLESALGEEGAAISHVYFPISGMISFLTRAGDISVESATVGADGMLGLPVFLGDGASEADCIVQVRGEAWRMPSTTFLTVIARCPELEASLKRYAAASIWMAYRSLACNYAHSLAQRSARWLLLILDHSPAGPLEVTHLLLSQMLGVRRAGVTNALGALQRRKIITTQRGFITIVDREALESEACSCSALMRARRHADL